MARARISNSRPASTYLCRLIGRELGRALGDQGVALADEAVALLVDRHDDLAPGAEGVGNGAGVADRHRRRSVAVPDAEQEDPVVLDVSGRDPAGQLVALAGLR